MKKKLQEVPFFFILLPLFFVLHGYAENFRSLRVADCLALAGAYLLMAVVLFALSWLLFRNSIKAALLTTFILSFYFFFGALHDFLVAQHIILHKYSLLLPLFLLTTILLIVYLKRRNSFSPLPLFLNALFLIYLVVDLASLALGITGRDSVKSTPYAQVERSFKPCDSCARPDIYFLLFDGYSSSKTLKENYHYDNSGLDSFLTGEGFRIQKDSRSNYFMTMFSMTSMLNLSYLANCPENIGSEDFTNLIGPLRDNEVTRFLSARGYSIVNNSIFDLAGHPSTIDQPFIPTRTKLITSRTLINYIVRDMGKWLTEHFVTAERYYNNVYHTNEQLLTQTLEESKKAPAAPRFVYTHLLLPHFPHLFDSLQHRRATKDVVADKEVVRLEPYLNYLPYTNARIKELISTIKKNSGGKAVIIFMSDHGFRHYPGGPVDERPFFYNQNAIYLPDRDYRLFYDSMSAVNEFRVLFNTLFRQDLPLLKDSTIFLKGGGF